MTDVGQIITAYRSALAAGQRGVLGTVVHVEGSAYRRPSARMIWLENGQRIGAVTGGCLESEIQQRARDVLESGRRQTVTYDLRSADDILWGSGLGCPGEVRVLLEPLCGDLPEDLAFIAECRRARSCGVVAMVYEAPEAAEVQAGRRQLLSHPEAPIQWSGIDGEALANTLQQVWTERRARSVAVKGADGPYRILLEYVDLAPTLVIFGAGDDARPLCRMASESGWVVQVIDPREAYARTERFPEAERVACVAVDGLDAATLPVDRGTAVVLMTHHFLNDLEILTGILPTAIPYVATLGPVARIRELCRRLVERGVLRSGEPSDNWFAPAGLDIGSETAEEIALSILAEAPRRPDRPQRRAPPTTQAGASRFAMIATILLAAGGGRRLGRHKPLLLHRGIPLVRHAAEAARAATAGPIIVVTGFEETKVAEVLKGDDVLLCSNTGWEEGIASSIRAGLSAVLEFPEKPGSVLFLVCDQPALDRILIRRLLAAHAARVGGITACRYSNTLGTPALFGARWFGELMELTGDVGARRLFERASDALYCIDWPEGAADIDRPGDLVRLAGAAADPNLY